MISRHMNSMVIMGICTGMRLIIPSATNSQFIDAVDGQASTLPLARTHRNIPTES